MAMRLKTRFTLVGIGLIIFIILTPILILFARGFKIDWETNQIVKTGTVVIRSQPEGASVWLDDKLERKKTPYTGRFIIPKDYTIRVEKEGYQSWSKRLSVLPQLVTWANLNREFIALFYSQPQLISERKTNYVSASKDRGQLIYSADTELHLLNIDYDESKTLGKNVAQGSFLNFTSTLEWQNGENVYDKLAGIDPNPFTQSQIESVRKVETNGDYTLINIQDQLYSFSPRTGVLLIDKGISSFALDDENVWYTQGSTLKNHNLRTARTDIIENGLPAYATSQLIRGEGHLFLVLDGNLYNINESLEKIYEGINFAYWNRSSNQLVFTNDNEILIFDPISKRTVLVLRSISQITSPILNAETGYIFFINENKVKAIELDDRDHRNIYTIIDLDPGIENRFVISGSGRLAYVYNNSHIKTYRIR
jgi:hypothetical protein